MSRILAKRKTVLVTFLSLALVISSACSNQPFPSKFSPAPFKDSPNAITLCFDLRDDSHPVAGMILKLNQTATVESHTLALPFDSTAAAMNREIYSTWGSYDESTIVNYHTSRSSNGIYDMAFVPSFGTTQADQWPEDPRELNQFSIYFIKSSNLTRHFIFKYPDADPERKRWLQNMSMVANTNIDAIGVVLPPDVVGKAIRRTNRTSVPDPIYEIGIAKFYPATQNAAQGVGAIHIKYELPPTENYKAIIEEGTKALILFISPSIQLVVRLLRKPKQKKLAKRLIWIFAGIQAIVLIVLLYFAYVSWQDSIGRAISQLTTAILSGLFTAYNLWEEKKSATATDPFVKTPPDST